MTGDAFAEEEAFGGEGFEVAAGAGEGFGIAAHHEGEGAGGGSGCAPAHAGVEVGASGPGGAAGERFGGGWIGGGEVVEDKAGAGVGKDAGRWRLTFWYAQRALRLTVNENGAILSQVCFPTLR